MARKRKKGIIKSDQLLQPAFREGRDFQVDSRVTAALDRFLSGETGTFTKTPEQREAQFQTEVLDPSLRNFKQDILPAITQRFVSRGGTGPANQATLLDAGTDLTTNLAALRSQFLRGDESLRFASDEAALARQQQGAQGTLQTQLLPIQLKSFLGAQAKGIESSDALSSFVKNLLNQQQDVGNQLAGAIRKSAGTNPFEFTPNQPGGGFLGLF